MKFHVYELQIDENSYFNVEIFRASFLSIEHLRRPSMFKSVHTLKFKVQLTPNFFFAKIHFLVPLIIIAKKLSRLIKSRDFYEAV